MEKAFDKKVSPAGKPWAPRRVEQKWPLLEKTGKMRRGFRFKIRQGTIQVTNTQPYAGSHQHGTKNIPAREMIGLGIVKDKKVVEATKQAIIDILKKK